MQSNYFLLMEEYFLDIPEKVIDFKENIDFYYDKDIAYMYMNF